MVIKDIRAFEVDLRRALPKVPDGPAYLSRRDRQPAGPLERYAAYRGNRGAAGASWRGVGCVLEAEDGTTGFGTTVTAGPVVPIINNHLRAQLVGQPLMATEKLYDLMCRLTAAYGGGGVTAGAISAVDVAAWDAKGKVLGRPVYELLGGPWRDRIPCYATGFEVEWYLELGFEAVKLPNPYGPPDGDEGLRLAEEMVAEARELLGPDRALMMDCWMAMDVDYMVRLAERLRQLLDALRDRVGILDLQVLHIDHPYRELEAAADLAEPLDVSRWSPGRLQHEMVAFEGVQKSEQLVIRTSLNGLPEVVAVAEMDRPLGVRRRGAQHQVDGGGSQLAALGVSRQVRLVHLNDGSLDPLQLGGQHTGDRHQQGFEVVVEVVGQYPGDKVGAAEGELEGRIGERPGAIEPALQVEAALPEWPDDDAGWSAAVGDLLLRRPGGQLATSWLRLYPIQSAHEALHHTARGVARQVPSVELAI